MDLSGPLALRIRRSALQMVHRAKASHIASALSIADIVAVLYAQVMRYDASNPRWSHRDRFILSKGHACVAVYAALAHSNFFPVTQLDTYGEDHSWLMNHISHKVPGVEFSTGSLGHGLPFAVGKSLASQMHGGTWRTFVLLSDGELDEGSNWESLMFAGHHRLDRLTVIIDYNKLQSLDSVFNTLGLEPLRTKLESFGAHVVEADGHDHCSLLAAMTLGRNPKPTVVIAHTVKGKGVSFMEDRVEWHYKNPNDVQLAEALSELGSPDA